METTGVENQFSQMGARFKIGELIVPKNRFGGGDTRAYALDIRKDARGEFFEFAVRPEVSVPLRAAVLQVDGAARHLLMMVRQEARTDRFLCGFDEREWFVAAVPGKATTIAQAKEALKPVIVRAAQWKNPLRRRELNQRKNRAFVRQGEWFFVPENPSGLNEKFILRDEPIRRGGGKPHRVEELFRTSGTTVYVCAQYPNGITVEHHQRLIQNEPAKRHLGWRMMVRDARVYARGKVRHSDHKTIVLREWHRVLMNTETETETMRNVAFLD